MPQEILVSVVLCTYNGAAFLDRQLKDILSQTYSNIEVIILDDCSSDETIAIAKKITQQDARVTIVENTATLGYNKNFEKGCCIAKGDIIAIADQDDAWALNKIETMLKEYDGISLLMHCNSKKFFDKERPSFENKYKTKRFSGTRAEQLLFENTCEGHTMILKQELLQYALPFAEDLSYDWWLAVVAAANGGVQWIDKTLVARRMHATNASEVKKKHADKKQRVINRLSKFYTVPNLPAKAKEIISEAIDKISNAPKSEIIGFFYKNRKIFFYYKHRPFPFISYSKAAKKMYKQICS